MFVTINLKNYFIELQNYLNLNRNFRLVVNSMSIEVSSFLYRNLKVLVILKSICK